jgi:hypothetical protein
MAEKYKAKSATKPNSDEIKALTEALAAPFDNDAVRFKPGKVVGTRALALVYVDARAIQDRLDEVMGVLGWQDEYEFLPDGSVVCRLRLRLGDEWITKVDVGAPSEQPDEGDRRKAAVSDALKRAAVKFGIGRYLYRVGEMWADYDPQKKRIVRPPVLPLEMQAKPAATAAVNGRGRKNEEKQAEKAKPAKAGGLPANGAELHKRLTAYDSQLAKQGLCKAGDLVKHVIQAGVKAGHDPEMTNWSEVAIHLAVEETKGFEAKLRQQTVKQKEVA